MGCTILIGVSNIRNNEKTAVVPPHGYFVYGDRLFWE
jgi:hypothetical protein